MRQADIVIQTDSYAENKENVKRKVNLCALERREAKFKQVRRE